ncbi:hypothetical protein A1Q1_07260 [Trichosporon asahii var. asahii CBS 2479]|uniref:Uncharacterized protein n=1 Tax=Trichosporon asahii var. asahii (strain ATCC 90039 / CBS 2479 / JCM 2466 / KCTC 7840 / NBRC 103889/ NCYC 2677 / UAMH 7654) TaxID=1186058 RepID=J5RA48_TRIAS|nr:hypothetical protein A1Q1_07260 [Trichosporon asahii var. asahii CBS 2479]EJT51498.1 hypothetical protein A1Q1_07260 [Trichosporon asahii var. asahii CBS 2479]
MAAVAPPAQPPQTTAVQLPAAQNPQLPNANPQTTSAAANPANPANPAKPVETTKEPAKPEQPDAKTDTKTAALPGLKTETKASSSSSPSSSPPSSAAKADAKDKDKDLKTSTTDAKTQSASPTLSATELATTVLDVAGQPTVQKQAQCEYLASLSILDARSVVERSFHVPSDCMKLVKDKGRKMRAAEGAHPADTRRHHDLSVRLSRREVGAQVGQVGREGVSLLREPAGRQHGALRGRPRHHGRLHGPPAPYHGLAITEGGQLPPRRGEMDRRPGPAQEARTEGVTPAAGPQSAARSTHERKPPPSWTTRPKWTGPPTAPAADVRRGP